ncbi:eukaryotic translation initiation factor 4G isoform X2 [Cynara cardunculus var. scolymus]|uniref:eukaryotic translation initiation factor 4G isoform X2 n=1 Tax=Cynara cardunculus var. scolymus TaxID=59895 RepID=UPI000D624A77|nr:eukaryotic translation initiation factor 4G isoform X2 [Cynara cardunculus var. scolymus]
MSFNQSRGDKNEPPQHRKLGRSGNAALQRNYSGGGGKGGGGGGSTTAPPSSSSSSSNRSFKKVGNYAQGVQPRVNSPNINSNSDLLNSSTPGGTTVPNGAHLQLPARGASGAPAAGATIKPSDVSTQKSTPGLPRAPQGNAAVPSSDATGPSTPTKDASRAFPLQFGSISPSLMNGMQIPARTSSAPPNLDEQKQAQARLEALKATKIPTSAVLKQQLPKKDAGVIDQSNASEAHSVPKAKKDVQALATPPATQSQKLSGPSIPGVPMQMSFHHSPLHVPYGGPNPQMQSQGMANSSLPMPLPIPLMGNPPQVQQQVFVTGLQHHQMQPQGIIHQGQGLNFSSQMGPPQMPPQLGNIGIGLGQHYPPQQTGKLGAHRKTVKITHPDTHEELRLDKRSDGYADGGSKGSGPRPHPHVLPQSQPVPTFPPGHMVNYYSNSYNANSLFYPPPTSNPLTSAQTTPGSQAPRFYSQVTVKPAANAHDKVSDSSLPGSLPAIDKNELPKTPRTHGETSSTHSQRDPETSSGSSTQHPNYTLSPMATKPTNATFGSFQSENLTNSSSTASAATVEDSVPLVNSEAEVAKEATVSKSSSFKEEPIKPGKKVQYTPLDQVGGQSASISTSILETVKSSTPFTGTKEEVSETSKKVVPIAVTASAPGSSLKGSSGEEGLKSIETIGSETNSDSSLKIEEPKAESAVSEDQGYVTTNEPEQHEVATSVSDLDKNSGAMEVTMTKIETGSLDPAVPAINDDKSLPSASAADADVLSAETSLSLGTCRGDDISSSDVSLSTLVNMGAEGAGNGESGTLDHGSAAVSVSVPDRPPSFDGEDVGNRASLISPTSSGSMDKTLSDTSKAKGNTSKPKKKKKEFLKFADAQGTTSDLYMAYKGPEEKKETPSAEIVENSSAITQKQASVDSSEKAVPCDEKRGHNKFEPDDWEDRADISTPKLETSFNGKSVDGMAKKYSRDFLLKFAEQCTELPQGFEFTPDTADVVMSNVNVSREPHPSPGRGGDRVPPGARLDRRPSNVGHDDRWNKSQGPMGSGRMQSDVSYAGNTTNFKPMTGGNYGMSRNRTQTPGQYGGGILSGTMQSPGPHMQRNNSDSDRWQRVAGNQKGLIPSPQTPMQVMHKAERKYEVGKVTDEEQAKQRQLKGILNKLTPQNFEKLFEQVKQVNIDNAGTLSGVINQIFDKALMEPTFCEMYANFCSRLAVELPDFSEDNEKITFKRLLLNKCQEEFERGEREEEEANRTEEEGEVKQTEEEREEKRIKARRRMLGNIRLIGELFKKKMLTERIMHECIKKLLGQYQNPDEEDIEALCKLMSTIGAMFDHPKAKEHMDVYFDTMFRLSNNMKLSSRVRFMLKDAIDLRKNNWQQRRKVEGPKKIDEVHRDAAQERHAQSSRMARGSSFNSSTRSRQPMEFAPRGSNVLPSPNAQMGGFRGLPQQQPRGYANQDARVEERSSFENRAVSFPLRPIGDDPITLGPQGGLARGMSVRGQSSMQSMHLPEMPSPADPRRHAAGPNGYGSGSIPERQTSGPRDEFVPRYTSERLAPSPAYDQSHVNRNAEHNFDRGMPSLPSPRVWMPTPSPNVPADKVWPEERLRDMSMEAIKEFYSARDEKEVVLCIKELNAPSFYPSMISIWVSDSFERKDADRDSLAKLLVNLTKSQDGVLSQDSLIRGLESVLASLEDSVNDAPKAAEYLGRIVGKMLLENVIPYKEVWQLIYEGGEEPGRLVEIGLAADVVGVILEMITSEKGEAFLNEIRAGSNLHVEGFLPRNSTKASRLDKFI